MKKVYKVVKVPSPGVYVSSSAHGKYCFTYKLNMSTVMEAESYGIFCFNSAKEAKQYIREYFNISSQSPRIILEAKAYGTPIYPKYISKGCFCSAFYSSNGKEYYTKPPNGTVCYNKIVPIRIF